MELVFAIVLVAITAAERLWEASDAVMVLSAVFRLLLLWLAVEFALRMLGRLDRRTGRTWEQIFNRIWENPLGLAFYMGMRGPGVFVGCAIGLS